MKFLNRYLFLSVVVMALFLFSNESVVLADDCVQKRSTPQAPDNFSKQINPLGSSPDAIAAGEKLYQKEAKPLACVQCHGMKGQGDGAMAKGMNPKPRDFSCSAMMKGISDGQLFWIIKNGSKGTGMMGFAALKDDQVWQVVSYLRKFSK